MNETGLTLSVHVTVGSGRPLARQSSDRLPLMSTVTEAPGNTSTLGGPVQHSNIQINTNIVQIMYTCICEQVTADCLKSLETDKSTGVDNLGPRLLKELGLNIAGPISVMFRQSISESAVLKDRRRANVTPIFKKENRQQSHNQPVSLTSIIWRSSNL